MMRLVQLFCLLAIVITSAGVRAEPMSPAEFAKFGEQVAGKMIADSWVPGGAVVIVSADGPLLLAGFGIANLETSAAVGPENTSFQVGSIAKMFTTIAALKLAAAGQLDLDKDLNRYLGDIRIPDRFGKPVTARHVLTHTSGFDPTISYNAPREGRASDAWLSRRLVRARQPGLVAAYDNIGFGVLGMAIAQIGGPAYEDGIEDMLLAPLRSKNLGTPRLRANCHTVGADGEAATCDRAVLGRLVKGAGGAEATPSDMALLMTALLSRDPRLLPADAYDQILNPDLHRFQAGLPGMALGLQEFVFGGHRAMGHGGVIDGFISQMALFPESGLGIFVVINGGGVAGNIDEEIRLSGLIRQQMASDDGGGAKIGQASALPAMIISEFAQKFINKDIDAVPNIETDTVLPPLNIDGNYVFTRNKFSHLLGRLFVEGTPSVRIEALDENTIEVERWGEYRRIGPMLFESTASPTPFPLGIGRIAFAELETGMLMAISSAAVFERNETWPLLRWIAPTSLVIFLTGAILALRGSSAGAISRRIGKIALAATGLIIIVTLLELEFGFLFTRVDQHFLALVIVWRAILVLSLAAMAWCALRSGGIGATVISRLTIGIGALGIILPGTYWFVAARLWVL